MLAIKITYLQEYLNEVTEHSFIKIVEDINEVFQSIDELYEDPHVQHVSWKGIEDEN